MRAQTVISLTLLAALASGFFYWQSHRGTAEPEGGPRRKAVTVQLTTARIGDAPVTLTAIGQITSKHSVAIRPQVSGELKQVFFSEGDDVKAGDKLFEIDPALYRAALAQAEAQVARDQAAIRAAETQEKRLLPLADKGYVTPQELLDAQAAAEQARASVQVSQAALRTARINLERAVIRAPIAGRTGALSIKAGNLVTANDTTPLVTINQLQPVQAEFSVPQSQLAAIQAAQAAGPVRIAAFAQADSSTPLAEGRLIFIDNAVNAATGTVKLKAEFDNRNEALWPGTFASFTATLSVEPNQVLVPELAVQPGAEGSYVYRVDAEHKAQLHPVTVARQVGRELVIASGLQGGEQIIARAPRDLNPGTPVQLADAAGENNGKAGKKPRADQAPQP